MGRRLFSRDPLTGLVRYFHPSADGNSFTIETVMDVESILDDNKREYNMHNHKASRKFPGDMKKIASLPLHIYMDLKQKGILDDQVAFKKWLNDPDNLYYRNAPGRV